MKKFLIFIGGFVAGILATILAFYLYSGANRPNDGGLVGLTLFEESGECISKNEIEIFQVINQNTALAKTIEYGDYGIRNYSDEIVVLIIDYNGKTFYDEQKIKIPKNMCARQIGTYQYTTVKDNFEKTVPAVVIE